jgi:hypothetical protein
MNEYNQALLNVQTFCLDRLNSDSNLSLDSLIQSDFGSQIISLYYKNDVINQDEYSFEKFISDLKDLFVKCKPTKALAESDQLEPWLEFSKRTRKEHRFNLYKRLLIAENKGDIIEQLDSDTYKILDCSHNPNELTYEWDRRGLVYGHVQSGKTANYVGLINRAFDAGYKIVIVFTGVTEDLRVQTQKRISHGIVGYNRNVLIGIGKQSDFNSLERIIPATTEERDLSKDDHILQNIVTTNNKSIWVIKKNKTVLENLIKWLDLQRQNNPRINEVPFLVIDDEADNASIQSLSKREYEDWGIAMQLSNLEEGNMDSLQEKKLQQAKEKVIKAINRNIRVILSLMSHKTFIAYTATPYSVINQSDIDLERKVYIGNKEYTIDSDSDLFPEHFIIPITAGKKYLGIERVFPTDKNRKLPIVVNINDVYPNDNLDKDYFPSERGSSYNFSDIPQSLKDAIVDFIVAIIVRKYRKLIDYNCMLVHTSPLTMHTDYLAYKVDEYINELLSLVANNQYLDKFNISLEKYKTNSKNKLFRTYFNAYYQFPSTIKKEDILNVLESRKDTEGNYIYAPFEVVSYHSSNDNNLKHNCRLLKFDLKDNRGERKYKNYIVVGGNRLSRGLTLEGLVLSYFVRNSTRQDSLYQMARWFGYRIGYEDLVKIYLPKDHILWFESVYKLEMNLRKDLEEINNEDSKILPRNAIIRLAYHTDLKESTKTRFPSICDPNKLRHTITKAMSWEGTLKSNRIIINDKIQKHNWELVKSIYYNIIKENEATLFNFSNINIREIKNKNINLINVNYKHVLNLLDGYKAHDKIKDEVTAVSEFIKRNNSDLKLWSFVLINKNTNNGELSIPEFLVDYYDQSELIKSKPISKVHRSHKNEGGVAYFPSILDGSSMDNIFDLIDESNYSEFKNSEFKSDFIMRKRNEILKPIILIYPTYSTGITDIAVFPLFYIFIPKIKNAQKVKYIIRRNNNE